MGFPEIMALANFLTVGWKCEVNAFNSHKHVLSAPANNGSLFVESYFYAFYG